MQGPEQLVGEGGPIRVAFLLQDLDFGGTQTQTLELVHRLSPDLFFPEIWCLTTARSLLPDPEAPRVPVHVLGRTASPGPGMLPGLWRRLRRHRPDILMLMTVVPNIWGRLLGRLARVPVVVGTCRGGGSPARQHERLLWPLSDHILCNARSLGDVLTERYGVSPSRLTPIHNGVDLERFRPPGPDVRRAHPPVVLCVARMAQDKDHATLISAFKTVVERLPDAELWLAGDGPLRDAVRRQADRELPPRCVRFIEPHRDVERWYHRAGILALSSVREALPNVVLEAMATALPVVATDVGGLSEAVEHERTGLLVPAGDPQRLADAITKLLSDVKLREAYGAAGRLRAEQLFDLATMVRRHEEVFLELHRARARRAPR